MLPKGAINAALPHPLTLSFFYFFTLLQNKWYLHFFFQSSSWFQHLPSPKVPLYPSRAVRPDPLPHPRTLARGAYRDVNVHAPPLPLGLRVFVCQLGIPEWLSHHWASGQGHILWSICRVSTSNHSKGVSLKSSNPFAARRLVREIKILKVLAGGPNIIGLTDLVRGIGDS